MKDTSVTNRYAVPCKNTTTDGLILQIMWR